MPRKRTEVDLAQIERLASIGCTDAEIAAVIGISREAFGRYHKPTPEVAEAIERGRNKGKQSLRHKQFQIALKGSVPMLIWLGKQLLGQKDKHESEAPVSGSGTVVVPAELSRDEWDAMSDRVRKEQAELEQNAAVQ